MTGPKAQTGYEPARNLEHEMTSAARSIDHDLTRRDVPATVRRGPAILALTRAPRSAWERLQAGQLGPIAETRIGRHTGARI